MKFRKTMMVAAVSMALGGCLGVSSASASSFTAGKVGKAISSKTLVKEVFTVEGSEVKCNTAKYEGVTEGTLEAGQYHSESQRLHPVYEGCEAFGFTSGVSVSTNSCDIIVKANLTGGKATTAIVDAPGKTCNGYVLTADPPFTNCTVVIPKQSIAGAVSFINGVSILKYLWKLAHFEYTVTQSNGLCPLTLGTHGNKEGEAGGSFNGEMQLSAEGGIQWTE